MRVAVSGVLLALVLGGCGARLPSKVEDTVERSIPVAHQVADNAAAACPSVKGNAPLTGVKRAKTAEPPSPAIGTTLESEPQIVDVFSLCTFRDPGDPKRAAAPLSSLRGTSRLEIRDAAEIEV